MYSCCAVGSSTELSSSPKRLSSTNLERRSGDSHFFSTDKAHHEIADMLWHTYSSLRTSLEGESPWRSLPSFPSRESLDRLSKDELLDELWRLHQHRIDVAIQCAGLETSGESRGASKSSSAGSGVGNVTANITEVPAPAYSVHVLEDMDPSSASRAFARTPGAQERDLDADHNTWLTEGLGEEWLVNLDDSRNILDFEDAGDDTAQSDLLSLAESEWMSGTSEFGRTHTVDEVRQEIRRMNDTGFILLHVGPSLPLCRNRNRGRFSGHTHLCFAGDLVPQHAVGFTRTLEDPQLRSQLGWMQALFPYCGPLKLTYRHCLLSSIYKPGRATLGMSHTQFRLFLRKLRCSQVVLQQTSLIFNKVCHTSVVAVSSTALSGVDRERQYEMGFREFVEGVVRAANAQYSHTPSCPTLALRIVRFMKERFMCLGKCFESDDFGKQIRTSASLADRLRGLHSTLHHVFQLMGPNRVDGGRTAVSISRFFLLLRKFAILEKSLTMVQASQSFLLATFNDEDDEMYSWDEWRMSASFDQFVEALVRICVAKYYGDGPDSLHRVMAELGEVFQDFVDAEIAPALRKCSAFPNPMPTQQRNSLDQPSPFSTPKSDLEWRSQGSDRPRSVGAVRSSYL